jgi:hypothetical protein
MSDWWSYRLSDFLLFSPRTYWRLFELHNEALWPLPLAMLALGLAALALAVLRPRHHGRLIAVLLALLWAFVGWSFLWQRYATINWAVTYIAPLFALEALLLVIVGGMRDRLAAEQRGLHRVASLALIAVGLCYFLLAPLSGRPWQGAEFFGTAPDPTAVATLGFLLSGRGKAIALLYPIPLLWCLVSSATLWAMDDPEAWVPLAAAALAAVAIIIRPAGTAKYRSLSSGQ